jgi:hypothetical protein
LSERSLFDPNPHHVVDLVLDEVPNKVVDLTSVDDSMVIDLTNESPPSPKVANLTAPDKMS